MNVPNAPSIERDKVVATLKWYRLEWEETLRGESILDAYASVGLTLCDMIASLELESDEILGVLGLPTYVELGPNTRKSVEAFKQ